MIALRKYRKEMQWTQAVLAEKCGVKKTTISMWEAGERKPDVYMLKKLAVLLHCTADDLLEPIKL